jgi:hypothetical protein
MKKTDWASKHWWIIIPIVLLLPFGINCLVNIETPSWWKYGIAGDGKYWLLFWGSYISSVATATMVYLTYSMLKQNEEDRRGNIFFRISSYKRFYFLEITNEGKSIAYDIRANINKEFIDNLHSTQQIYLNRLNENTIVLKPNESKYILIEANCTGDFKVLDIKQNNMEPVTITEEYLNKIKVAPIIITGKYKTINKSFTIDEKLYINDFWGGYISLDSVIDEELPKIRKELKEIKERLNNPVLPDMLVK